MAGRDHETTWREDDDDDLEEEESDAVDLDEGPDENDRHLMDDQEDGLVQCPRCNKYVWSEAQRCHKCGHYFSGEAWQMLDSPKPMGLWPRMRLWVTVGIIVVILIEVILIGVHWMRV